MNDSTFPLLRSPEFQELLHETSRRPLIRRELADFELPKGASAEEVWGSLTAMRRSIAYFSPNVECSASAAHMNWHTVPASLQYSLSRLTELTQRGSELDSIIEERRSSRFVTQQYIEEILANLEYDGFEPDYESIRATLLAERPGKSAPAKLASNYHAIMQHLDDFADRPFDRSLLEEFYSLLIEGITSEELVDSASRLVLPRIDDTATRDFRLETVVAIGNDLMTEPSQSPIMVSMLINCKFWRYSLFGQCNNLVSNIASRFYLLKKGYPAFRYIPKTKILDEWKRLGTNMAGAAYTYEEAHPTEGSDTDWTPYYDTMMKLMLRSVEKTHRTLLELKEADDSLISAIDGIDNLNYRQAMLLQQAVLNPGAEFRIATHEKKHGIVYSTARADLEQLAERGFLARMTIDTANVYKADARLRFLLEQYAR